MGLKWTFLLVVLGIVQVQVSTEAEACLIGFKKERGNCTDENECDEENNPCGKNSTCHNTVGSYYCSCKEGFYSKKENFTATTGQCQDINECRRYSNLCPKNYTCENSIGSFMCVCSPGFNITRENGTCEDINECAIAPPKCGPHGSCNNTPGSYTCTCPMGFRNHGNNNTPCEDIDECDSMQDMCGENGDCFNSPGSYHCVCYAGYSNFGNNQTKCTELKCDRANNTSKQAKMGELLNLFSKSCKSLSQNDHQHSGETLLKHLFNVSGEVVSSGNFNDGSTLTMFLGAMEDTLRLIGPQLNKPLTRVDNEVSEALLAVKKDVTPPKGNEILKTDDVNLNISWKTAAGEQYPGFAYVALVSYKNLSSSRTVLMKSPEAESSNTSYQLNSRVVTALVSNKHTDKLPEPVTLTFKHLQKGEVSNRLNYSCVYWDKDEGAWSGRGCVKAEFNSTQTTCSWSHLSSFAVLMALYPVKDTFELVLITQVGLAVSLVCLCVCILTFWLCRSIKGTRTTIHLHLCLSLFVADFLFLFFISSTKNPLGCAVVAGLLHFFFLSAFCWMLLEGVQLYRMVVLVFNTTLRPLYMVAVGYGAPLAIVIISAIAYRKGYGTKRHCWLSLEKDFIWSFFAPVCIIVLLNSFFFVVTVWRLAGKFSSLNPDLSKLKKLRGFLVTAIAQLCILGGMWVFGCFLFQEKGTVVMLYLFTILNSLQGALIFIMHCLLNKAVREEYSKLCGGICIPQKKRYSEFSSNQSSNSQKPLRSAQSTGESQI